MYDIKVLFKQLPWVKKLDALINGFINDANCHYHIYQMAANCCEKGNHRDSTSWLFSRTSGLPTRSAEDSPILLCSRKPVRVLRGGKSLPERQHLGLKVAKKLKLPFCRCNFPIASLFKSLLTEVWWTHISTHCNILTTALSPIITLLMIAHSLHQRISKCSWDILP